MQRFTYFIVLLLVGLLAACRQDPKPVEVTRVVTETVLQTVEVTRVVTETVVEIQEIEITQTPTIVPTAEVAHVILKRDAIAYREDGTPAIVVAQGTQIFALPENCSVKDPFYDVSWWVKYNGFWYSNDAIDGGYSNCEHDNIEEVEFIPKGAAWRSTNTSALDVYVIRANINQLINESGKQLGYGSRFYLDGYNGNMYNVQDHTEATFVLTNAEFGSFLYVYSFPAGWSIGWTELQDFLIYYLTGSLQPEP